MEWLVFLGLWQLVLKGFQVSQKVLKEESQVRFATWWQYRAALSLFMQTLTKVERFLSYCTVTGKHWSRKPVFFIISLTDLSSKQWHVIRDQCYLCILNLKLRVGNIHHQKALANSVWTQTSSTSICSLTLFCWSAGQSREMVTFRRAGVNAKYMMYSWDYSEIWKHMTACTKETQ